MVATAWWPRPQVIRAEDLAAGDTAAQYEGQAITVYGSWKRAEVPPEGVAKLLILQGVGRVEVQCEFRTFPEVYTRPGGLQIPSEVTVRGRCVGRQGNVVILRECELVE